MKCYQRHDLVAPPKEERIGSYEKCANSILINSYECSFEFDFTAGAKDKKFFPERADSRLRCSQFDVTVRTARIREISEGGNLVWDEFVQQLQPLSHGGRTKYGDTGDITVRPVQTRDQALADGIAVGTEHNWDRLSSLLGYLWRRFTASRYEHGYLSPYQIGCKFG